MKTIKMKYIFFLSIVMVFLPIILGTLMTSPVRGDEKTPSMAIEDKYVPQSKEEIKVKRDAPKSAAEETVPRSKGKGSKKAKAIPRTEVRSSNSDGPTVADVRAAKREQGLKGFFFQDSKTKKYFLQDFDGAMYKFDDKKWIKIKDAEDSD